MGGRKLLYTTKGKIKKVGNAEVHSLRIRGAEQNSNFDESITDGSRKVKSPAQQSVNKHSFLEPVTPIQPKDGVAKKKPPRFCREQRS